MYPWNLFFLIKDTSIKFPLWKQSGQICRTQPLSNSGTRSHYELLLSWKQPFYGFLAGGCTPWGLIPDPYFLWTISFSPIQKEPHFYMTPTSETDGINCHSLSQRSSSLWAVCSLSWFQYVLCRILFACQQSNRWDSGSCMLSFLSRVWVFMTPWTVAHQGSLPMECSRPEYWSGLPFPSPVCLPDPGIQPRHLY